MWEIYKWKSINETFPKLFTFRNKVSNVCWWNIQPLKSILWQDFIYLINIYVFPYLGVHISNYYAANVGGPKAGVRAYQGAEENTWKWVITFLLMCESNI